MKRNSILLCSAALALLSAGVATLVAKDPAPAAPLQEASVLVTPERRTEAETAILRDVMSVLVTPDRDRAVSAANRFSRVPVMPRSLDRYEMNFTETSPGGVKVDPVRIPFVVQQPMIKDAAGKPTVFLSGFYDSTSKSVQLYSTAAKSYVAAVEHPFIKARKK